MKAYSLVGVVVLVVCVSSPVLGRTILGGLVGNDLTDLGNNGNEAAYAPPNLAGFDAVFFASNEPQFQGAEAAFNVFDNAVGGGANKWCCGAGDGGAFPLIVGANFSSTLASGQNRIQLTRFTLTSGNDAPDRDPSVWRLQGSSNTTNGLDGTWDDIFVRSGPANTQDWTARDQTISYSPVDGDAFLNTGLYSAFRLFVTGTQGGATTGANFQLGEIELFGNVVALPEPASVALWTLLGASGVAYAWFRRRRSLA